MNTAAPPPPRFSWQNIRFFLANRSVSSLATFVVIVVAGLIGSLPLFDGPGYESALAAGLFIPVITIIATALELSKERLAPMDALSRGVANGCKWVGLAWLITMLHGLRHGYCDAWGGTVHW
ncbi:MAG TPA: hypothetical protein PK156_48455, partial [Polyangium sp.]|nr:hypothetical protein [Polyangium sp.]